MSLVTSQITSHTIVYSTVYSGADQRKHQSSAPLAFVRGIHRWPGNSPHTKGQQRGKCFRLMTSSCFVQPKHGHVFCIAGPLLGESIGHLWIPHTKGQWRAYSSLKIEGSHDTKVVVTGSTGGCREDIPSVSPETSKLTSGQPSDFSVYQTPGGRLNKKDGLTRYGNSHVKDKTS